MKFRTKVIAGISIALVIILIFIVVDQSWKADLQESQATNNINEQQKSTDSTVDRNKEKDVAEDDTNAEERSKGKNSEGAGAIDSQNENELESEFVARNNSTTTQAEKPEGESPNSEMKMDVPNTSTEKHTSGLYFATREEAVAYGFSRFSAEEIEIYKRASSNGLTPEQEELAIQIAYSRFSAEEIAAIEDALNR